MEFSNTISKSISMRLVELYDAPFICALRSNESFNKHLSKTNDSIIEQEKWIESYKEREDKQQEYYFIIKRNSDDKEIGTVRLYDFKNDIKSFCWGSWILNEDKIPSAALESALLVYKIAFTELGFEKSHFDVRKNNVKVINFHKKLGAQVVSENEIDFFFIYTKEVYLSIVEKYKKYQVQNG